MAAGGVKAQDKSGSASSSPRLRRHAIDDLSALRAFSEVVASGSFLVAAQRLGVAPSTVSKHISSLEQSLNTYLVNRSTRQTALTEAGARFLEHCQRILGEVDEAEAAIIEGNTEPQGHLRITAPAVLAVRHISPRFHEFAKRHPRISTEMILTSHRVDLTKEGIDLAIRITDSLDPGMVITKLGQNRRVFCASPEYLSQYGEPKSPEDLKNHNCLISSGITANNKWPMTVNSELVHVAVSGTFVADNGEAVLDVVRGGVGIAMLPTFLVYEALRKGEIVEVLSSFAAANTSIFAVLPNRRYVPPKTRAFLNFLRAAFGSEPYWDRALSSAAVVAPPAK